VNVAVRNRYGFPRVQDLFRLAVHVQPEVALYDLSHCYARMVMAPDLETGGDLYCGVQSIILLNIVPFLQTTALSSE
jgi:hypothetical protein